MNDIAKLKTKPDIRFTGFTDAWEQRKLGEVAEFNPKATLPDSFEYVDLESVMGTDLVSHRTETKVSAPSRAQRLARRCDVFYQTVRPYQKNNHLFDKPDDNYVFSTGYAQMRPSIDSRFLFSSLQEERFVKAVLDRCTGTSYPAINVNDLSEIEIKVPCDETEQAKIGTTFKTLDRLITLHQREYDKTVNIKKAMLEKMFPKDGADKPEIRFAGFTDAWEQRKLGEIMWGKISNGIMNKPGRNDLDVRHINVVNLYAPSFIHTEDLEYFYATKADVEKCNVNIGDIFLTRSSLKVEGIAQANVLLDNSGVYVFDDHIMRMKVGIEYAPFFVKELLNHKTVKGQFMEKSKTGTMTTIGQEDISSSYGYFPSYKEQKQIGDFIFNFDRLITLHQRKHLLCLKTAVSA